MLIGLAGAGLSAVAIGLIFAQNVKNFNLDGTALGSTGGIVLPSFLLKSAETFYESVQIGSAEAVRGFRETGRFEAIYAGIEDSQEEALVAGLASVRERFPVSLTRELAFNFAAELARSDARIAAELFDFALRLQRANDSEKEMTGDIFEKLWTLDEGRCSVSGRLRSGRRSWKDPDADILVDLQGAALRTTTAESAHRPLFAHVAPEILARPTFLMLVRLFDVFQCPTCGDLQEDEYSAKEEAVIQSFLVEVTRTAVMRRAFRHVSQVAPHMMATGSWLSILKRIWFQRRKGRPCVFEHVFLGNLQEDAAGQPIAGGLHCWLKFYLEEVRGTAKYLGFLYNNPDAGLADNRFVSGKFVWEYGGYSLVKDQGGFFIGTSPEWQLACGTVAFFETLTPDLADAHGWQPWLASRDVGYTKDIVHDGHRYRHVVCCHGRSSQPWQDATAQEMPDLSTTFSTFLGNANPDDDPDAEALERVRSDVELAERLPTWLVTEGIALQEDSELCTECVRFVTSRGCRTLRGALLEVRSVFEFGLEDAVEVSQTQGYERMRELVDDSGDAAELLLNAAEEAAVKPEVSLTSAVPGVLRELQQRGRKGRRVHQPLRLLLTGQGQGAPVPDIVQLLELAEREGGDEVGVSLSDRLDLVRKLFLVEKPSAKQGMAMQQA